jgi:hypothetical protein
LLAPATILGTPAEAGLNQKNSTSLALGTQTAFDFYPPKNSGGQAPRYSRRLYPKMLNGARKSLSNLVLDFVTNLRNTTLPENIRREGDINEHCAAKKIVIRRSGQMQ